MPPTSPMPTPRPAGDRGGEGHGQARQHLIIYIVGDNGSRPKARPSAPERGRAVQRRRRAGRGPARVFLRRPWGTDQTYNAHGGRLDLGLRHNRSNGPSRSPRIWRHPPRHGGLLARPDHRQGRDPQPVPATSSTSFRPSSRRRDGSRAAETVDGIEQKPIAGPDGHTGTRTRTARPGHTQYFEMMGNRGIYDDGWYANTTPIVDPVAH